MKAFVTGATGFLGGRLTQRLLERGDAVVALVRRDVDLPGSSSCAATSLIWTSCATRCAAATRCSTPRRATRSAFRLGRPTRCTTSTCAARRTCSTRLRISGGSSPSRRSTSSGTRTGGSASRTCSAARSLRLSEMIDRVSPRPVRLTIPTALLEPAIPAGPLIGKLMGTGPNLRELVSASAGVAYWASDAKARRELGYDPRRFAETR